jgi:hypothetical protein
MVENPTADAASHNKEAAVSAEKVETKPIARLLGSISYDNEEDWELFLNTMTSQQVLIVLVTAARYAQAQGVFNLEESELVSRAIKRLKIHTQEAIKAAQKDQTEESSQPSFEEKQS